MSSPIDSALRVAQRGAEFAALAGGVLILSAAGVVSIDVLLRKFVSVTLGGADELSGYALAIGSTWSFAFVMLSRSNVRIDALYQMMSRRWAVVCDLIALTALLVFASVVAWYGFTVMSYAWEIGSRSNSSLAVPLAVPLTLWWIGYAWFVLCGLVLMLRSVSAMFSRDFHLVNRLIGARSIQEEAAEELQTATEILKAKS
ncbi:MAG: TRAP transporter small permease [Burkholderiaceae bacterium]|jgi:TRAP-type C4-dicarboxylate transport system permease small subunit|nr:TRAP transporter small permease [Burkholderiaceae bacterium]